jgi:DNA-binding NarL/FixJ family response regulator
MQMGSESEEALDKLVKTHWQSPSHELAPHGAAPNLWPGFLTGQAEQPVRVLLIDDDASLRGVVAQELLGDRRIRLVGQASSVREGRQLISQSEFDVMLVDLNLGDGTGFALIEHLKAVRPAAEAIVISAIEDTQHALKAFELGATGYLVKNAGFGSFAQAVLQVVNGGASITPNLARRLLSKFEPAAGSARALQNPSKAMAKLSRREKDVLTLIASGYTSTDIGTRLCIGSETVNTHIKNIYRKLDVRNRAHAVSLAATHGLL